MADQASGPSKASAGSGLRGWLFGSRLGWSGLLLRLSLAVVMFPHGAQKALGWWGGHGWNGTVEFFTTQVGLPTAAAIALIVLEFLGPVALLFGFATRLVAAGFIALMIGAIQKVHLANGFFMNWANDPQMREGYEYHLLALGIAAALLLGGGGSLAIDRRLAGGR